eukprot:549978-Hanusia_phi.AAC.2
MFEDFYGYCPLVSPVSTKDNLITDFTHFQVYYDDQSNCVSFDELCIDEMNQKRKDVSMDDWMDSIRQVNDSFHVAGATCLSKTISRRDLNESVASR